MATEDSVKLLQEAWLLTDDKESRKMLAKETKLIARQALVTQTIQDIKEAVRVFRGALRLLFELLMLLFTIATMCMMMLFYFVAVVVGSPL